MAYSDKIRGTYQAQLKGPNTVNLQVGYANQILMQAPEGVTITVPDTTHIQICIEVSVQQ